MMSNPNGRATMRYVSRHIRIRVYAREKAEITWHYSAQEQALGFHAVRAARKSH